MIDCLSLNTDLKPIWLRYADMFSRRKSPFHQPKSQDVDSWPSFEGVAKIHAQALVIPQQVSNKHAVVDVQMIHASLSEV